MAAAVDDVEKGTPDDLAHDPAQQTTTGDTLALPAVPAGLALSRAPTAPYLLLAFAPTPAHPDDPLCRSRRWKVWLTLLAALLVMLVRFPTTPFPRRSLTASLFIQSALTSSCSSGAAPWIQADLGGNVRSTLSTASRTAAHPVRNPPADSSPALPLPPRLRRRALVLEPAQRGLRAATVLRPRHPLLDRFPRSLRRRSQLWRAPRPALLLGLFRRRAHDQASLAHPLSSRILLTCPCPQLGRLDRRHLACERARNGHELLQVRPLSEPGRVCRLIFSPFQRRNLRRARYAAPSPGTDGTR